jgi:short-subunit dehydrogenase
MPDPFARWSEMQRSARPVWMSALAGFCAFMAVVYTPWDFFLKPVAVDTEVWFGISFTGWAAKVMAIPHWFVYAAGAYGFWRLRPWMWPWAALYVGQVALAMLIWGLVTLEGFDGKLIALATAVPFAILARMLFTERERFRPEPPDLRVRYGDWALVTGASAGIGAAFATRLAELGVSVVVTARREERLRALATDLERRFEVKTRVVAIDLSEPGAAERLADEVRDLEIGMLVNNAGYGMAGRFVDQDTARLRAMVTLNCVTPVVLTNRLLPAMRERGRGAVVVTGSIGGRQPVPLNGVYSATKAFDLFFGEMLWAEMLGSGVDVLVLEPGPTATEFQEVAGETAHAGEPPEQVVRVALDALGRQPSVVSGWFNWIRTGAARLLPRSTAALVAGRVMAQWTPPERQ